MVFLKHILLLFLVLACGKPAVKISPKKTAERDVASVIKFPEGRENRFMVGEEISIKPNLKIDSENIVSCEAEELPEGLSINSLTCEIKGVPEEMIDEKTYEIIVTYNENEKQTVEIEITIDAEPVAPTLSYNNVILDFGVAANIVPELDNGNSPITDCTVDVPLPAGLNLNDEDCKITGTPTAVAVNATYTVTATNAKGTDSATIDISVVGTAPVLSYANQTLTVGTAAVINPSLNTGGSAITGCTILPALSAGLSIDNSTCVISGTPTAAKSNTTYTVSVTNGALSTAQIQIKVNKIAPTVNMGNLTLTVGADSGTNTPAVTNGGGTISSCTVSPSLPTGLAVNNTTCAITGTPTTSQAQTTYTMTVSNGLTATDTFKITISKIAPTIVFADQSFTVGTSVGNVNPTTLNNGGASITSCSILPALPAGLSLGSTNCRITGTPTLESALTTYTITTSNGLNDSDTFDLEVAKIAPTLSYANTTLTVGTAATIHPTLNNGGAAITSCTSVNLPPGLAVNNTTCVISGTPTTAQSFTTANIVVMNGGLAGAGTISIKINKIAPTVALGNQTFTVGTDIGSVTPTLNNGGSAITSCSTTPALPAGLAINNTTCEITGTPTTSQVQTTYTLTASNGTAGTDTFKITINKIAPTISYAAQNFTVGTSVGTVIPTLNNGGASITSCTATLPAGLSINNTNCRITGTPTTEFATADVTVSVSNGIASTGTVNITIAKIAPTISYSNAIWTVGIPVSVTPTLNAGGAAITSCVVDQPLPAGLSLHNTTCVISGTPTTAVAADDYEITVSNGLTGSDISNFTVNAIAPSGLTYDTHTVTYNMGHAITDNEVATINDGGAALTYTAASLPAGLSIDSLVGTITGTPTALTTATNYTIRATNAVGFTTKVIRMSVVAGSPTGLTYADDEPTYTFGSAITANTVTANNTNGATVTYTISPALNGTGLSINSSTGRISGTPTVAFDATTYTVTPTNSAGAGETFDIEITIDPIAPTLSYNTTVARVGEPITISTASYSNGGDTTTCSAAAAVVSDLNDLGLTLTGCTITGTPIAASPLTAYTITATNTVGHADATLNLAVVPAYNDFYYATNVNDRTVQWWAVAEKSHDLSMIDPTGDGSNSIFIADAGDTLTEPFAHPNGRFLFVNYFDTSAGSQKLAALTLSPITGEPTYKGEVDLATPGTIYNSVIHPNGNFIYVRGGDSIYVVSLELDTGNLSLIHSYGTVGCTAAPASGGPMQMHPSGNYIYFTCDGNGKLIKADIDLNNGMIVGETNLGDLTGGTPITKFNLSADGRSAMVTNGSILYTLWLNDTGDLLQNRPNGPLPGDLVFHPNGKFIFNLISTTQAIKTSEYNYGTNLANRGTQSLNLSGYGLNLEKIKLTSDGSAVIVHTNNTDEHFMVLPIIANGILDEDNAISAGTDYNGNYLLHVSVLRDLMYFVDPIADKLIGYHLDTEGTPIAQATSGGSDVSITGLVSAFTNPYSSMVFTTTSAGMSSKVVDYSGATLTAVSSYTNSNMRTAKYDGAVHRNGEWIYALSADGILNFTLDEDASALTLQSTYASTASYRGADVDPLMKYFITTNSDKVIGCDLLLNRSVNSCGLEFDLDGDIYDFKFDPTGQEAIALMYNPADENVELKVFNRNLTLSNTYIFNYDVHSAPDYGSQSMVFSKWGNCLYVAPAKDDDTASGVDEEDIFGFKLVPATVNLTAMGGLNVRSHATGSAQYISMKLSSDETLLYAYDVASGKLDVIEVNPKNCSVDAVRKTITIGNDDFTDMIMP